MSTMNDVDYEIRQILDQLASKESSVRVARTRLASLLEGATVHSLRTDPAAHIPGASSQSKKRNIPVQWLNELIVARDNLVLSKKENKLLVKNKDKLLVLLEKNRVATEKLGGELETGLQATYANTPEAARGGAYRTNVDRHNDVATAKRDLVAATKKQVTIRNELQRQCGDLGELVRRNTELDDIEMQLFMMEGEAGIKRRELANVADEVKSMQKLLERKQILLTKTAAIDDTTDIMMLEANKRSAQQRIQKHEKFIRDNGVSAQHRAMQIQKLERKMTLTGTVLRDVLVEKGAISADEPDESVDAADLDCVMREINSATEQGTIHDEQLGFLDAQIENAENRVRILSHAIHSCQGGADLAEKQCQAKIELLDQERHSQEATAEVMVQRQEQARAQKEAELDALLTKQKQSRA